MTNISRQSRTERRLGNLLIAGFRAQLSEQQSLQEELTRLQTQLNRLRQHRRWLQLQSAFAQLRDNHSKNS